MEYNFPTEFTDKYTCFSNNTIFIIPHDLNCCNLENCLFGNSGKIVDKDSSFNSNRNTNDTSFETLKFMSVLTDNYTNRIRKTITNSRIKILKKLGIKQ